MKKYLLFRVDGNEESGEGVLVAVEYGKDIDDVTKRLICLANEDALGLEKYSRGFTAATHGPEVRVEGPFHYNMTAILMPDYGELNDILQYRVLEQEVGAVPAL